MNAAYNNVSNTVYLFGGMLQNGDLSTIIYKSEMNQSSMTTLDETVTYAQDRDGIYQSSVTVGTQVYFIILDYSDQYTIYLFDTI